MADKTLSPDNNKSNAAEQDRRAFLKGAGKYAVVVPPAMTFLLSTTLASEAVAASNNRVQDGAQESLITSPPAPPPPPPPPPPPSTMASSLDLSASSQSPKGKKGYNFFEMLLRLLGLG